jgi:hypothetical protein
LLPNDLIVIRNPGVDHGEHAGHQEGAGELRKHCEISIGHTFSPIELKIGVFPILVIQNQKNRIKKSNTWISTSASALR